MGRIPGPLWCVNWAPPPGTQTFLSLQGRTPPAPALPTSRSSPTHCLHAVSRDTQWLDSGLSPLQITFPYSQAFYSQRSSDVLGNTELETEKHASSAAAVLTEQMFWSQGMMLFSDKTNTVTLWNRMFIYINCKDKTGDFAEDFCLQVGCAFPLLCHRWYLGVHFWEVQLELHTPKSLGASADSGPRLLVLLRQNHRGLHRGIFLFSCLPACDLYTCQQSFRANWCVCAEWFWGRNSAYCRNPVYITVQSCACYEMTISLMPGSYQAYTLLS